MDVEPVHTLRGHRGGVLCVAMGCGGEVCFSGSTDTTIRVWQLPGDLSDPFDAYGQLQCFMYMYMCMYTSLVPRPHPQLPVAASYGKAWERGYMYTIHVLVWGEGTQQWLYYSGPNEYHNIAFIHVYM